MYTVTCANTTGYMFHAAIRCVMSGADVRMWRTYIDTDIDIDKGIHIHVRINTHTHTLGELAVMSWMIS